MYGPMIIRHNHASDELCTDRCPGFDTEKLKMPAGGGSRYALNKKPFTDEQIEQADRELAEREEVARQSVISAGGKGEMIPVGGPKKIITSEPLPVVDFPCQMEDEKAKEKVGWTIGHCCRRSHVDLKSLSFRRLLLEIAMRSVAWHQAGVNPEFPKDVEDDNTLYDRFVESIDAFGERAIKGYMSWEGVDERF